MQGSQFHIQITHGNLEEWVSALEARKIEFMVSALNAGVKDYSTVTPQSLVIFGQ